MLSPLNYKPLDYTANIGFKETLLGDEPTTHEQIEAHTRQDVITPMIDNYKMLRKVCRDPYPSNRN